MKKINSINKLMALALPLALLAGCGGSKSPAPLGSTIAIHIDKVDWKITAGVCLGDWQYHALYITVLGPNGRPVANADIYVNLDLSVGTSAGLFTVNRLFDDPAWIAGTSAPVAAPNIATWITTGSYATNTGDTGTKALVVGTDLSCEHKGNLDVHSGSTYGSISIDVHT